MVGCCPLVQFHWHLRWVCTFLSTRSARADLDFQVKSMVTTQVGEEPDAIGLYCIAEEGIKGLPSKASLMASKTFLAFLRAVEI
jgi:hypothetical protein